MKIYQLLDNNNKPIGEAPTKRACIAYKSLLVFNALVDGESFKNIDAIKKFKIIRKEAW